MPALLIRMSMPPKAAHLFDRGVDLVFVGHVHRHADGLRARGLEFGGGGVGRFLVQVGNDDLGAFLCEEDGDFLADAAGRAGDVGDLVLELHGECSLRVEG
jgi:hypothetical protein